MRHTVFLCGTYAEPTATEQEFLRACRTAVERVAPVEARLLRPFELCRRIVENAPLAVILAGGLVNEAIDFAAITAATRRHGGAVVFWNLEDPSGFDRVARVRDKVDLYFTADAGAALFNLDAGDVRHLPHAASADLHRRRVAPFGERVLPVSLATNFTPSRAALVRDLTRYISAQDLVVFGSGWAVPGTVTQPAPPNSAAFADICAASRFVLTGGPVATVVNDRFSLTPTSPRPHVYSAALAGAPQIFCGLESGEVVEIFERDREIKWVTDVRDVPGILAWAREQPGEWLAMAQRAQRRVLRHHLVEHRMAAVLEAVNGFLRNEIPVVVPPVEDDETIAIIDDGEAVRPRDVGRSAA